MPYNKIVKVATEGDSNLLSSKEVTVATEPQPTSRHLSIQHRKPMSGMNTYPKINVGGREGKKQALQGKCKQKQMEKPCRPPWRPTHNTGETAALA